MSQMPMDNYINMLGGDSADAVSRFYGMGQYGSYDPITLTPIFAHQDTVIIRGMTSTPI
jgi:hypothetical protein